MLRPSLLLCLDIGSLKQHHANWQPSAVAQQRRTCLHDQVLCLQVL